MFTPVAAVAALVFAFTKSAWISKQEVGTDKMSTIAGHIRDGAMAFLSREYKILAVFALVVAVFLGFLRFNECPISLAGGSRIHLGCNLLGTRWLLRYAYRNFCERSSTNAARKGLSEALTVAFSGGTVMGMSVVGLGVLGVSGLAIIFYQTGILAGSEGTDWRRIVSVVTGFSMGASSIALFARVGGGIFTKAADVGADLVGKVEAGIP